MSKKDQKKTFFREKPPLGKNARAEETPRDDLSPEFRTDKMDLDGQWGWKNFKSSDLQKFLEKLFELQKHTWQTLRENGSHPIKIADINPDAQKRLRIIKQDDLEVLYSLKITSIIRVWGIKEKNILWLLWWDPEHEIYPSPLKHT